MKEFVIFVNKILNNLLDNLLNNLCNEKELSKSMGNLPFSRRKL